MRAWISRRWQGEWGVYLRFMGSLLLIVAGVFGYFSITGCGEPVNNGCGPTGQGGTFSSAYTYPTSIASPPYNFSMSGTGGAALANGPMFLSGDVLPGSEVTRYITYTAEPGKDPTRIEWTPPQGALTFTFSTLPTNPDGPAPYAFNNEPRLSLPLVITYNAPLLPAYTSTLVVGEILVGIRVSETDDIHVLNYTISAAASRTQAAPSLIPSAPTLPSDGAPAATVSALQVQRWYWSPGITLTTELCQQIYGWLQSPSTFTAMRMPVTTTGVSNQSYELPVLFPIDSNPSTTVISARPKMNINVTGIPDLPLEVRSDRIAFMENWLPSAPGEHWVALGVAQAPKIICPAGLSRPSWEFNFAFSVHPDSPIAALPMYYCQDGQNAPPIDSRALNFLAGQKDGNTAPSTQIEGITCLGPQEHILNTNPVINVGNPNTVWNVFPLDEVRLKHYVQVIGLAPTITLSIDSDKAGFGWRVYKGDDKAPNLLNEVDITQPYTALPSTMFFWLIGTVPAGTSPGSYNFTFRVNKGADPNTYGSSADMVWVGAWAPPPPPGGAKYSIYLPLVIKQ
jgi:hypothetical protein